MTGRGSAERMKRTRQRRRAGLRVIRVQVDEARLADVLVDSGHLSPLVADDPDKLREAVERHLAGLVAVSVEGGGK